MAGMQINLPSIIVTLWALSWVSNDYKGRSKSSALTNSWSPEVHKGADGKLISLGLPGFTRIVIATQPKWC